MVSVPCHIKSVRTHLGLKCQTERRVGEGGSSTNEGKTFHSLLCKSSGIFKSNTQIILTEILVIRTEPNLY